MNYTVDRVEEGTYVLLSRADEKEELIIPAEQYSGQLREGDIVRVDIEHGETVIEVLKADTVRQRRKVEDLLKKLQNKQH